MNGDATIEKENLNLNKEVELSYGSIWFHERVYINDFQTSFTIAINGSNNVTGGDGIAFVIQVKQIF